MCLRYNLFKNQCIFESEFMEMDREAIVSLLSPMLMKLKPVEQSDKGTAEKVTWKMLKKLINWNIRFILLTYFTVNIRFISVLCEKMAKTYDIWKFWNLFTNKVVLPSVMLWYGMHFAN